MPDHERISADIVRLDLRLTRLLSDARTATVWRSDQLRFERTRAASGICSLRRTAARFRQKA
jgi:hypothetical protein